MLDDPSSPVCCAVNYVRSAANFAAANWGRVHVSMYVNDQGGLYICRYRPSVHNESSAQEERNPWVHSSKSSASSRFHFQSTILKKEMDNELTIVFSSDIEEYSHHKKLKKKSDLLSSNGSGSVQRYSARVRRCGGQLLFFASTG